MDGASMNRYEKQLYTVFKTFDVDNEEALDKSAVNELCDALQLEDRGAALIDTLFERRANRVTFAQFRNGLLAVLGADATGSTVATGSPSATTTFNASCTTSSNVDIPTQNSDDDSSGREEAPKFVFGSKKYGRRSRPQRASLAADEPSSPRSSSASRLDSDDRRARQRARCRRSASAMESREENASDALATTGAVEHDRRIDRDEALALCRGLSMDRIDRRLVERIFEDSGSADTTVGEFFDRLNASLTTSMEEAARGTDACVSPCAANIDDENGATVAADVVLEAWERAGVRRPRRLLAELGFSSAVLRPPELERALDDELRTLAEPAGERGPLLAAALALSRLRHERERFRADVATAERDKLRSDVAEANRRAGLLAQEVDDSHARLEGELRASLRRAEARHADAARSAAAELATERERAAAERTRLDAELARRCDSESRLRMDVTAARARADELETRAALTEEKLAEAECERARLATELVAAQERCAMVAAGEGAAAAHATELEELRRENRVLRDRIDELCAELETQARTPREFATDAPFGGHLSAELDSLLTNEHSEYRDSSIAGHAQTGAVARLLEILEAIPSIQTECESCRRVAEDVRSVREEVQQARDSVARRMRATAEVAVQVDATAEATAANAGPEVLRSEIAEIERRHDEEKLKLTGLVGELESSLEQMRGEYDKCEEYWNAKLEEERDAYAEEQRLGDERLAELAAKIGEYERQFAASAALPTIDERHSLEAQFTDLEDEFARYRATTDAELTAQAQRLAERERELAARDAELRRLSERAARRPRDYHNPAFAAPSEPQRAEVRELRARTARAEAAVRRLHARLAAADLLVKDLYVENCQLAHRRPL